MAGGSASGSKSKTNSGSSFNQDVWAPQGSALTDLYSKIGSLFNNTSSGMLNQISGSVDNMNSVNNSAQDAWKNQLAGGAYGNMDIQNQLMGSLNQSLLQPSNTQEINNMIMGGSGNNYADAMKNQYIQDANRATDNMLANLDARAAASGMSGGSRHGIATSRGLEDINRNLQSNLAQTGYNTFDKDLDRKLQIAGNADANTLSRQQMMQQMLGSQSDVMQNALAGSGSMQNLGLGSFSPYMMPWQLAGMYGNIVGGPTVLGSGSSNSSGKGAGLGASVNLGG